MQAYVNEKTAMQSFIDNRLSNNPKALSFDPIKKNENTRFHSKQNKSLQGE